MFSKWLVSGGPGGCSQIIFLPEGSKSLTGSVPVNKKTFHSIYFSVTCSLLLANFPIEKPNSLSLCSPLLKLKV